MEIKRLLITDECNQSIPDRLREAGIIVDHASDITPQKLVEVIAVSMHPSASLICHSGTHLLTQVKLHPTEL